MILIKLHNSLTKLALIIKKLIYSLTINRFIPILEDEAQMIYRMPSFRGPCISMGFRVCGG